MADLPKQNHSASLRFERRAAQRFKCNKAFAYRANGTCYRGRIVDLSSTGIGIRVFHELAVGHVLAIVLKRAGIFHSEHFVKVVHVRQAESEGEGWFAGCEFGEPLTPEQFRCFLTKQEASQLDTFLGAKHRPALRGCS